jgi:hypothetical protein
MNNILNRGLWIVFTVLTPLTFVGLFSQNSIPGDILYPVKIGIENAGSVIFSFTPESHASYSTSLTTRRFEEAQQLIVAKSDTQGLQTLVTQTEKAQESLTKVQNVEQKKAIEEKLVKSIDTYQEKLTALQKTVDPQYIAPTPTQTPTPTPTTYQKRVIPQGTNPIPTRIIPTLPPAQPTLPVNNPTGPQPVANIINSIEDTKKQLDAIKAQVQQSALIMPVTTSPSPTIPPLIPTATPIPQLNPKQYTTPPTPTVETKSGTTELNKDLYPKSGLVPN